MTALVGVTNQGQGTPTALAQIIGDELALPVDAITVLSGDTAMTPYGGGTWASRGMPIGGSATLLAARALAAKIRVVAGDAPGGAPGRRRAGRRPRGHPRQRARLSATPSWRGPSTSDPARSRGSSRASRRPCTTRTPQPWTFTNGAHLAVVEVDVETGPRARPPLRGGGRLRAHRQPGAGRGPDRRRRRPGPGRRALRALRLRRLRPAPDRDAHGLRRAHRRRPAAVRAAPSGDAGAVDRRAVSRARAKPAPPARRRRSSTR